MLVIFVDMMTMGFAMPKVVVLIRNAIPEIVEEILTMVNVIEEFKKIAETGELPAGFQWTSIQWQRGKGWMGWCRGPNGCNDRLPVKKMPPEAIRDIEDKLEWNASHYLPGDEPE